MCGIIGYIGKKDVSPILLEGLRRLEYRGYDSAGLAVLNGGTIEVRRSPGKLSNLEAAVAKHPVHGTLGLGHTRWATHGRPSEENAHPHTDCKGGIVVIHNGIIENYLDLKERLLKEGHSFKSETDTEVIAHLIEEKLKSLAGHRKGSGPDLKEPLFFEGVRQALREMKGAYALAVLWAEAPNCLVAAKTASPLVIGLGAGETFLASDVPAFLEHTRKVVFLDDGELAVLAPESRSFFDLDGKKIEKSPVQIHWDRSMAEKSGYRHFMLKEIYEQPRAVEDTLRGRLSPLGGPMLSTEMGLDKEFLKSLGHVHFLGCGTAHHAGMVGAYMIERCAGLPARAEIASEFRYREPLLEPGTLAVAISQSGETADTIAAVKLAKEKGARVLAICNSVGSSLTREADATLYTRCGPEIGVASTKAFTGQLTALATLSLHLGAARRTLQEPESRRMVEQLLHLPHLIRDTLSLDSQVQAIAKAYHRAEHFLYLGRHLNYPIALEGALKLKEISYIHAEGFAAGEMKHGPIALIDEELPIVAIATRSAVHEKVLSNLAEAHARGGEIIALATKGDSKVRAKATHVLELPEAPELLSPILNVIPLQILAYHIASLRGCDVDQPRNLAKSVTVE